MAIDLTAGGRLHVHPFVTEAKVAWVADRIGKALRNDRHAKADIQESFSTSDAPFAFAQLANLRNLPEYDAAPLQSRLIAEDTEVDDFRNLRYYSLRPNFDALKHGKDNDGNVVSPLVPEGDTYQYAFGWTAEDLALKLAKRGFKVGVTLEEIANDITGVLRRLPSEMLRVALETEDFVVFRALQDGVTSTSALQGGTIPQTGATVAPNAPLSRDALVQAIIEAGTRTDAQGNRIPLAGQFRLVVPQGQGQYAGWLLTNRLVGVSTLPGSAGGTAVEYEVGGPNPLGRIVGVVESIWIDNATSWYLVPVPGTTVRPSLLKLRLAGHTAPELHVKSEAIPVGGAPVYGIFNHLSFDNDTADIRIRQFTNSGLLTQDQIVWSNGSGVAPSV